MGVRAIAVALSVIVLFGFLPGPVSAQGTYEVLHSLVEPAFPPIGKLFEASNGRVYGVAQRAGRFGKGAVIAYDRHPDGTVTATTLHEFSGPDGARPSAGVIEASDGALYGTTAAGGTHDRGTVYRVTLDGTLTVLHSFDGVIGSNPSTELVETPDGDLYGTTLGGGPLGAGTLFRITRTGTLTVLHTFGSGSVFGTEDALIEGGDGKLYGIARYGGGIFSGGAVYSITSDGTFAIVHAFETRPESPGPVRPISFIDGGDGFFYGTTAASSHLGIWYPSTVFRVSRSAAFTVLFTDSSIGSDLDNLVRGSDGSFYGTTADAGAGDGTLFHLTASGVMATIHQFAYAFGATPNPLTVMSDGSLFGSTSRGGFSGRGVVFQRTLAGVYRPVHMFSGRDPLTPYTSLIPGPDGALYGVSCSGGAFNAGTIFKLTDEGAVLTVLHSFAFWDGSCPQGMLAFGADGAVYGSTRLYGLGFGGTLFRLTTSGQFTVLKFFSAPDGWRPTGLVRASDGHFYGTTLRGGVGNGGTIFRMSAAGQVTTLHSFNSEFTGLFAGETPLMQASNGALYGSTSVGPYRLTIGGALTHFDPLGRQMDWPFTQGPDGALYGVGGGAPVKLYRMTLDGSVTVLHTFTEIDQYSYGGLLPAPDGSFYGTTTLGNGYTGSLFQFFGSGAPVTLHHFDGSDGLAPVGTPVLGPDGALYGTTYYGGSSGRGVIYRLRRP